MTTPRTDDTTPHLPWARTQAVPYTAPDTAPALNPPAWSGRKTAIAAALAIGISSMGAVAAAAALPAGTTQGSTGLPGSQPPRGPGQGGAGSMPQAPADPRASTT